MGRPIHDIRHGWDGRHKVPTFTWIGIFYYHSRSVTDGTFQLYHGWNVFVIVPIVSWMGHPNRNLDWTFLLSFSKLWMGHPNQSRMGRPSRDIHMSIFTIVTNGTHLPVTDGMTGL